MRIRPNDLAVLVVMGTAASVIAAAPTAAAGPLPTLCAPAGIRIMCQTPRTVDVKDPLPAAGYRPFGATPWLIGGR